MYKSKNRLKEESIIITETFRDTNQLYRAYVKDFGSRGDNMQFL
jgi:hypothetical protein